MKTDIEIAHEYKMQDIRDVASGAGIGCEDLHLYGNYMAKIPVTAIDESRIAGSNLILVTAITPTRAGGQDHGIHRVVHGFEPYREKAITLPSEPSLGPCFGMKAEQRAEVMHGWSPGRHQPAFYR